MNWQRGTILASLAISAGCSYGPAPRIYLLNSPAAAVSAYASASDKTRIQLLPLLVPDYLDTTDLLLRSGTYELKASRSGSWGERLSKGMTDALSQALAERLPKDFITLDPSGEKSALQIAVDVAACDVWSDGRCVLTASWNILGEGSQSGSRAGRATFEIPAAGPSVIGDDAVVAAMALAVGQLADRLAVEIQRRGGS